MLHNKIISNIFKKKNNLNSKDDMAEQLIDEHMNICNEDEETEYVLQELERKREKDTAYLQESDISKNYIDNAPAVKFANIVFSEALQKKASDIHFEPFELVVLIRFRVDGTMQEYRRISKASYHSICTRIKIMANMNIAEKRIPQDGKSIFQNSNKSYDFRVSALPTIYGEKLVIRILYKSELTGSQGDLDTIIDGDKNLNVLLNNTSGMVLITGPTGSGKSTTLYSMLKRLNNSEKNIITIEDPIEYEMFGINQVSLNLRAGLTFGSGLRCILRQDPDVIMIGEIRDEETAQIAVRAAITGHLVFSTLHTRDAPSSVNRLADMGVKNYLVGDALIAVIAQRLVRVICPHCKKGYKASVQQRNKLNLRVETLFKGNGCEKCSFTGYMGRRIVYEMMYLTPEHRRIIERKGSIEELRQCSINNGMVILKDYCAKLVKEGVTTYDEFSKISYIDQQV